MDENVNMVESDENDDYEPQKKQMKNKFEELDAILSGTGKRRIKTPNKKMFQPQDLLETMKKEMAVLETTLKRPSCLEKLYKGLSTNFDHVNQSTSQPVTSQPTFVTKLRTSLDDKTVDSLCFLRSNVKIVTDFEISFGVVFLSFLGIYKTR